MRYYLKQKISCAYRYVYAQIDSGYYIYCISPNIVFTRPPISFVFFWGTKCDFGIYRELTCNFPFFIPPSLLIPTVKNKCFFLQHRRDRKVRARTQEMSCNSVSLSFLQSTWATTQHHQLCNGILRPNSVPLVAPRHPRRLVVEAMSTTRTQDRTARHSRIRKKASFCFCLFLFPSF